jgi:hypothetical protein
MVDRIRDRWRIGKQDELWFRAEDAIYHETRLQPCLYRPREGGKRKSIQSLLKLENNLYEEFQRCATQLCDVKPTGDLEWEWYFLMQHHGVPTRLLDWSDGALIALHFAVRDKLLPVKSGSVVYVLDPNWLVDEIENDPDCSDAKDNWREYSKADPYRNDPEDWERLYLPADEEDLREPLLATPRNPILWDSPHVSRRVAAQRSRLMVFGTDPLWLVDMANRKGSRLDKIRVPAIAVSRIKRELKDAGITESVVYPDMDGLGCELKQLWQESR